MGIQVMDFSNIFANRAPNKACSVGTLGIPKIKKSVSYVLSGHSFNMPF
jgi:hypothetical protein